MERDFPLERQLAVKQRYCPDSAIGAWWS